MQRIIAVIRGSHIYYCTFSEQGIYKIIKGNIEIVEPVVRTYLRAPAKVDYAGFPHGLGVAGYVFGTVVQHRGISVCGNKNEVAFGCHAFISRH